VSTFLAPADGVTFNPKVRRGLLWYLLGRLFPALFGMPFHVDAVLRGPDGKVKKRVRRYNTVTTAGKNALMDQLLASPTLGKPTHMAVGTGTGGTTTLTTEIDRNALTSKNRSTNVVTMVGDWAAGDGTGTITEAGVFDASSAGNMHLYSSFTGIPKLAADSLTLTWTWTGA
jgi:hypothetical protein